MIVICLEGCHGSGKTSLLGELAAAGFNVLDEAFINMPSYTKALHPQSLMMESMWVCQWFERLLRHKSDMDNDNGADAIYFADRSPYSAVFYSRGGRGKLLSPLIRAQIEELQEAAQIEVITVYVKVRRPVLWDRIQARLRREPSRHLFSENKREWMEQTLHFYDGFEWDCTVDNSDASVDAVMESLVTRISRHSPRFQRIVSTDGGRGNPDGTLCPSAEANFTPRVRAASLCSGDLDEDGDDAADRLLESSADSEEGLELAGGGESCGAAHTTPVRRKPKKAAATMCINPVALPLSAAGTPPLTPEGVTRPPQRHISPDTVMARSVPFPDEDGKATAKAAAAEGATKTPTEEDGALGLEAQLAAEQPVVAQ